MILDGDPSLAPASSKGVHSWVTTNTDLRFRPRTLSHAKSGYSAYGAAQLLPELLTKVCSSGHDKLAQQYNKSYSLFVTFPISWIKFSTSLRLLRSAGIL